MTEPTGSTPFHPAETARDAITEIIHHGARRLLAAAFEAEVESHLAAYRDVRDAQGRQAVVRNGFLPEREVMTGVGPVAVQQPRVRVRPPADGTEVPPFRSKILPPYLRKARSIEELLPWLYLKGVSTGGYQEALAALLGPDAPGLSASTIVRLKKSWEQEHEAWSKRSLAGKRFVYVWADGVYFNVRLEDDRACILVLIGATADGNKELLAVHDGVRESEQSWHEVLLDLKAQGLETSPELAVGDGSLGFWKAVRKVWPKTRSQRCWTHKTTNVLNYLPKRAQPEAKRRLHEIWMAETREEADRAFNTFVEVYEAKYPKAAGCIVKDREELMAFYDFPAEHWRHLRTTNPIESTFATMRLRTSKTKGCGSRAATLSMVFKLAESAEKSWRRLNGHGLLGDVIQGTPFKDGIKQDAAA
jgi:putative transposase